MNVPMIPLLTNIVIYHKTGGEVVIVLARSKSSPCSQMTAGRHTPFIILLLTELDSAGNTPVSGLGHQLRHDASGRNI